MLDGKSPKPAYSPLKYLQLIIEKNLVEENITTASTRNLPEIGLAFWVIQQMEVSF
jgi:hypothetical protein